MDHLLQMSNSRFRNTGQVFPAALHIISYVIRKSALCKIAASRWKTSLWKIYGGSEWEL